MESLLAPAPRYPGKPGKKPIPIAERLWARVTNRGGPGCWEWTGAVMKSGHGQIGVAGNRVALVHRVAFEIQNGPIPDGLDVCHHCDNPPCVRGDHLFLGSRADNNRDAAAKGRMHPGEANGMAKLTASDARAIRESPEPAQVLAERHGVSPGAIHHIRRGSTWRHLADPPPTVQLQLF